MDSVYGMSKYIHFNWCNGNRPKSNFTRVQFSEPVSLLGYLQKHEKLKGSYINKKPIPSSKGADLQKLYSLS